LTDGYPQREHELETAGVQFEKPVYVQQLQEGKMLDHEGVERSFRSVGKQHLLKWEIVEGEGGWYKLLDPAEDNT
jgi:hypothetical protein